MSVWVRHRVPPLNWVLRGLLGAVPHAEAPERSPFKATAASGEMPAGDATAAILKVTVVAEMLLGHREDFEH